MEKNKIFISHGDIILDKIYDGDLNLLKEDGGGCNWNDLYNLAYMGETCYAFGSVGNDREGTIAVNSLNKLGINTEGIIVENKETNIMNIIIPNQSLDDNTVLHSWYSPITNTYTMDFSKNLPTDIPENLKQNQIYVILDKFLPSNLEFIKNIPNKKVCLDVGSTRYFEHFTKQYLTSFFKEANYVQLNESVSSLLLERLQVKDYIELFELLDLELLVLTKGKKGAFFVYKENGEIKEVENTPKVVVDIVDSSGAGDAFFSCLVREYAYTNKIDSNFIDKSFELANSASIEVLSQVGSRRS